MLKEIRYDPRSIALLAGLIGFALLASAKRLVLAPGFEMYAAPFFYLLAYGYFGLRVAIPVALLTTASSILWWGHPFTVGLAIAQLFFLQATQPYLRSVSTRILVFTLAIGVPSSYVFLKWNYGASDAIFALACIRKLLNDVTLAALVDLFMLLFTVRAIPFEFSRRPSFSLVQSMQASTTLIVMMSGLTLYFTQVWSFPASFASSQRQVADQAELLVLTKPDAGSQVQIISVMGKDVPLAISRDRNWLLSARIKQELGCGQIEDGRPVNGPNDRDTFAYWASACVLGQHRHNRGSYYLWSTGPVAEAAYQRILLQMLGPAFILLIAGIIELFVTILTRQSASAVFKLLDSFGKPALIAPAEIRIDEFAIPTQRFIEANNRYAAAVGERQQLSEAVGELQAAIDLRLVTDISFDPAQGVLRYTEVGLDRAPLTAIQQIHPNDQLAFATAAQDREAFVEFRLATGGHNDWYLLLARNPLAPSIWHSGCILRLRQSKLAQDKILQQARLMELGGMASALSHEIKQPLFTISLAAETGSMLLEGIDNERAERARGKFANIIEQVERGRSIISHVSRYSRIDMDDEEPFDLIEGITAVAKFMRPLLVQANTRLEFSGLSEPLIVGLPRVGLEQIIVNAVQNSVDAIVARRESSSTESAGEIVIALRRQAAGAVIEITDNGTGVQGPRPELAFDAFVTTKGPDKGTGLGLYISRQIAMEIGGSISLASREPPHNGAILTIEIPPSALCAQNYDAPVPVAGWRAA